MIKLLYAVPILFIIGCENITGLGNDYCTLDSYITAYSNNTSEQQREVLSHNTKLKEICE